MSEKEIKPSESTKLSEMSDEELVAQLQQGNYTALGEIISRYGRSLYGFLVRYLADTHLAEDVYQDTILKVAQKHENFDPSMRFRPWLFTIAANLAKDECRKRKQRNKDLPPELIAPKAINSPPLEAERREELNLLSVAFSELPQEARAVVLMHFKEGMRYREIAEVLSIPIGTVKSRIHGAVKRLASLWNQSAAALASAAIGR